MYNKESFQTQLSEAQVPFDKRETSKEEVRTCKECKIEKPLMDNFYYHKIHNCFSNTCKDCKNIKRREKFAKKEKTPAPEINNEVRQCVSCKEEKSLKEFYYHTGISAFLTDCKICYNKKRKAARTATPEEKIKARELAVKPRNIVDAARTKLQSYKAYDKKKGYDCDITLDFVVDKFIQPCEYCGEQASGLDRKDNTKGHTKDNCVPCCWECNTLKLNNFTYEQMLIMGKALKEARKIKTE